MGLKDIFKKKDNNKELNKDEAENMIENTDDEADEIINEQENAEVTEKEKAADIETEEINKLLREKMNNVDFQIRFLIEHKVLPAKLNDDPIYVITALAVDKGAYVNNFYNGIYRQNKLENPYIADDFTVSDPMDICGVKYLKIDMPEKNFSETLCKTVYVIYNDRYTKYLYLTVETDSDGEDKLGSWIDGEHEEYDMGDRNIEDIISEIIEDEEIVQEKYTNIIEKLFDREAKPMGIFKDPEEIKKHSQMFMNAIMQVQKYKEQDKRDEALKLIKEVIRREAANYVDTEDKEYHSFRNAFEVLLYANHVHPFNFQKKTKKQLEGMQIELSLAYLVYGGMMLEKQQYDKAIDILWKAVDANPVDVQLLFAIADAYKGKGYYKTYFTLMKRAHVYAVRKVDIGRIYRNYAYYFMQIKNYDLAIILAYASKYFDNTGNLFENCKNRIEKEAEKQFEEPALEIIKKTMLANGITWGAKELALSVTNMLNRQFTETNNEQGMKMSAQLLAELKPGV